MSAASLTRLLLGAVAAALLSACLQDTLPIDSAPAQTLAVVEVEPNAKLFWQIGASAALLAVAKDEQGVALASQPSFVWTSSNPAIATIDDTGTVTAIAEGTATISAGAEGIAGLASITVNTAAVAVQGQVRYQDKEYTPLGFNEAKVVYKPVRHAVVDLLDGNGTILQSVATDAQGRFMLDPVAPQPVQLRVLAKGAAATGYAVEVSDLSGNLYAVTKPLDTATLGTDIALDISIASGAAAAYNVYDALTVGMQFLHELSGATPPALAAFWAPGNNNGTYFCSGYDAAYCQRGGGIYVYSNSYYGDTDEFDDDVLWHEFGHYVAANFSKDDSHGGCHLLTSNDLDLRLSWSEGWGDFMPAAIKSWAGSSAQTLGLLSTAAGMASTYYVDNIVGGARISIDIADPAQGLSSDPYLYATNEIAIAKILWRLTEAFGRAKVWEVVSGYLPASPAIANLEDFWQGWLVRHAPVGADMTALEGIFTERQIHYREDGYENDAAASAARKAVLSIEETHYLYRADQSADLDTVTFDAAAGVSYTISTALLRNGIDTFLRLKDANGSEIATNDDAADIYYAYDGICGEYRYRNSTTALASRITFTATASGLYSIEVSTTTNPVPYPSAGRYGTYNLSVTSP